MVSIEDAKDALDLAIRALKRKAKVTNLKIGDSIVPNVIAVDRWNRLEGVFFAVDLHPDGSEEAGEDITIDARLQSLVSKARKNADKLLEEKIAAWAILNAVEHHNSIWLQEHMAWNSRCVLKKGDCLEKLAIEQSLLDA